MAKVHYKCVEQYFIQLIDNKKMEKHTEKRGREKERKEEKRKGKILIHHSSILVTTVSIPFLDPLGDLCV